MKKISRRSMIMGGLAAVVLASSPLQVSAKSTRKPIQYPEGMTDPTERRWYRWRLREKRKLKKEYQTAETNPKELKFDTIDFVMKRDYIKREYKKLNRKLSRTKQRYLVEYLPELKNTLTKYAERDAQFPEITKIPKDYFDPSLYMAIIAYQLGKDPKKELVKKGKFKGEIVESNAYLYDPMKLTRGGMWTTEKSEKKFGWVSDNNLKLRLLKNYGKKIKIKITKDGKVDYADKYINQQVSIDEGVKWVMERSVKKILPVGVIKLKYTFKKEDLVSNTLMFDKNIVKIYDEKLVELIPPDKCVVPGKTVIALRHHYELTYEPSVRKTLEKMNHQDGDKFVDGVLKIQAQLKSKK